MKKYYFFTLLLIFCSFLIGCCNDFKQTGVPAKVLTINEHILEGQMIGMLLGSSSGSISNDVIKVGVEMQIRGKLILADLKLSHAELAYYKDVNIIPVDVRYRAGLTRLIINLFGRTVYKNKCTAFDHQ